MGRAEFAFGIVRERCGLMLEHGLAFRHQFGLPGASQWPLGGSVGRHRGFMCPNLPVVLRPRFEYCGRRRVSLLASPLLLLIPFWWFCWWWRPQKYKNDFSILGSRLNRAWLAQSSAIHIGASQCFLKQHTSIDQDHNQVQSTVPVPNEDMP